MEVENKRGVRGPHPRIVEGYVFCSVFGDDPEMCRRLLELALGISIRELEIVHPERMLESNRESRAGSIDLFCVDNKGNRYDVEAQVTRRKNEHLRARHYQSLMDATLLKRGAKVEGLTWSVVLFICDFDPFDRGLCMYDCRTVCLQTHEVVDDRRRVVFLNTHGVVSEEVSGGLASFLRYACSGEVDNDVFVSDIEDKVHGLIEDPQWLEGYMTLQDEIDAIAESVREQALIEGRAMLPCYLRR